MARKEDKRKQKEKREKIFLGVGAVLLVGVLAIQAPKLMGSNGSKSGSPSTSTASTLLTTGTAGVTTTSGSSGVSPAGAVVAPSEDFTAGPGQLASLRLFAAKDPFAQQMGNGTGTVPAGPTTKTTRTGTTKTKTTSSTTTPIPPTPTTTSPATTYLSAVIEVNGAQEAVNVSPEGSDQPQGFPAASPVFVLKSASRSSVVIGILGGQLSSGAQGLTIKKGQSVTLVNTADGTRYVVKLISVSTATAQAPTTATATTATTDAGPPPPVPPTTITSTTTTGTTTTTG